MDRPQPLWRHRLWQIAPWLALALYLALALPQLSLPGLHYDEAKEAGVNAMEMLQHQNVSAFRSAGLQWGSLFLPLMVQDYIGALNVYLALPFMALFGPTVPGLRLLGIASGLATLILVWQLGNSYHQGSDGSSGRAGSIAVLMLAVSPSFLFWSRQGIFVTNVVVTLAVATVWAGLRWWRSGRPSHLYLTALLAGLGLWTKLLFIWVMGAIAGVLLLAWLAVKLSLATGTSSAERPSASVAKWPPAGVLTAALGVFLLALSPLILFNQQTAGTFSSILGNLGNSYYGVENTAFLGNLSTRLDQVVTLLRGDHFWYLGGLFANPLAPWIAAGLVLLALLRSRAARPTLLLCLLFVFLLVLQSCFTVSDLFITHYAILQPFLILLVALAVDALFANWKLEIGISHWIPMLACAGLVAWFAADLQVDIRYHRALSQTGGHAAHSDASYQLAQWLEAREAGQPLALDWGLDAPVRYLSLNRIQPLELFGYERIDGPDQAFSRRLGPFLGDPSRLYLLHTPEDTIFQGRREALETLAVSHGLNVVEETLFRERSGRPLYVVLSLK